MADVKSVECPRCGSQPGDSCRTGADKWVEPHKARRDAYEASLIVGDSAAMAEGPRGPDAFEGSELRIGSLFSGYGGLEQGVAAIIGGRTVWVSDIDGAPTAKRPHPTGACAILAHRYPGVPNLGDISKVAWADVEPIDVLTGGFPCQDVSHAGRRKGLKRGETRTGLWGEMCRAIEYLQPRLVFAENVKGLLSAKADSDVEPCAWCLGDDSDEHLRALGAVLADLADIRYDARWFGIRASDIGASHDRFRVFILAFPAGTEPDLEGFIAQVAGDSEHTGLGSLPGQPAQQDRAGAPAPAGPCGPAADAGRLRGQEGRTDGPGQEPGEGSPGLRGGRPDASADTDRVGERCEPDPVADVRADARAGAGHVGRREQGEAQAVADAGGQRHGRGQDAGGVDGLERRADDGAPEARPESGGGGDQAAADAQGDEQREPHNVGPRGGQSGVGCQHGRGPAAEGEVSWGVYGPAVQRWADVIGRQPPPPTIPGTKADDQGVVRPILNPWFVEWMMGLPEGWVCDVPGLSNSAMTHALGNGVVPQQAAAAVSVLLTAACWE